MRSLRTQIELGSGVKAGLLFTPHLFSFKRETNLTFELDEANPNATFEVVADILYCAALNAFVLDSRGTFEDAPFTRGDFHEFMYANPKEFGKVANLALQALTGKSIQDLAEDAKNAPETAKNETSEDSDGKKKLFARLIGKK